MSSWSGLVAKPTMPDALAKEYPIKWRSRRAKIARPVRVWLSDPRDEHFEDLPSSMNASKEGLHFTSGRNRVRRAARFRDFSGQFTTRPDEPRGCAGGRPCGGIARQQVWLGRHSDDAHDLP